MKDSRIGESLWLEWTGTGGAGLVAYFTETHVDLENEIVRRALASSLQRDGIAISLGEGFKFVEAGDISYLYAGYVNDEIDMTICDADGMTEDGNTADDVVEITLVEFPWVL